MDIDIFPHKTPNNERIFASDSLTSDSQNLKTILYNFRIVKLYDNYEEQSTSLSD